MIEMYGDAKRDLRSERVGYNFTIRVLPGTPPLSRILNHRTTPELTPIGAVVARKITEVLPKDIWIKSLVIMPDHLHLCLWIHAPLKLTILQLLAKVLVFSEKEICAAHALSGIWQRPGHLFQCFSKEVFLQKIAYDQGNILRWKMDHNMRELSHPHRITHSKLDPAYAWEGYGNLELLDGTHFLPCYISRRASDDAVAHFTNLALKLAQTGWTLIGGFVSERERQLLHTVREKITPRIIHLAATRLEDCKVSAQLAKALYEGRFLRLTSAKMDTCTRERCVWHNLWAEHFCGQWRDAVEAHFRQRAPLTPQQATYIHDFLTRWPSPRPK